MSLGCDITFSKKVFLPCYRHLKDSTADINLLWGGRYSGKSHFVAQKLIIDCLSKEYFRCVFIKKTAESIQESQWQTVKEIIEDWGMDHLFTFNISPLGIKCINGNRFMARGCDKPGKLKSIRNPSHAWYEEGDQLSESDYTVASSTLRGPKGIKVQEWISFNPECEGNYKEHWIYKKFFVSHFKTMYDNFNGKISVTLPKTGKQYDIQYTATHTTYLDNPHCPESDQAKVEAYKIDSPYYYNVYCLGKWGLKEVKSPFLYNFKIDKHVGKVVHNPKHITYLSFDFNRNPICCSVWQMLPGSKIRCTEVIKLKNSDIYKLCDVIISRYEEPELFIVTGDSTGLNSSALVKDDLNYYDVIQEKLGLNDSQIQLVNNPKIEENQLHCNRVFARYDIMMDEDKCQPLVFDCQFVEIRADGKMKKDDREDEAQQADVLDTMRYFLNRFVD